MEIDRDNVADVLAALRAKNGTADSGGQRASSDSPGQSPHQSQSAAPVQPTGPQQAVQPIQTGDSFEVSAAGSVQSEQTERSKQHGQPDQLPLGSVLAGLDAAVTAVLEFDAGSVCDGEALEAIEQLGRQRRRLDAASLKAIAVADQLDATSGAGIPATLAQHLAGAAGSSPGKAKADVEAARAIHGRATGELIRTPVTGQGPLAQMGQLLASGQTSAAHVDVAVQTLEKVPARLATGENMAAVTSFVAGQSTSTTPKQIRVLANRLIRNLEPETDDHYDPEAFNRRSLTMNTDITGMVHGSYQLDPAAGAELIAILNPLAAPHPDQKNESGATIARDQRTPAQRRADAFSDLIRAGATYLGPTNDGSSNSTSGSNHAEGSGNGEASAGTSGGSSNSNSSSAGGGNRINGSGNGPGSQVPGQPGQRQESGAGGVVFPGQTAARTAKPTAVPGTDDTNPGTDGANGAAADLFSIGDEPPTTGTGTGGGAGRKPSKPSKPSGSRAGKLRPSRRQNRVSIVTSMDQIKTLEDQRTGRHRPIDPSPSYCDQTGPIDAGTLALMSCNALFERVVLDAKGALLDLGLAVRLASPAQKRALAIRDGGCVAPGCNRPPSWCEIHHVLWYSHDGPTDIANLALECPSHHAAVHAGLMEVKMIEGIPYVRATTKGTKTAGTTTPIGAIAHPDDSTWIRNSYFDKLKTADNAARTIILNNQTQHPKAA